MLQKSIAISATTAYTVSVMENLIISCLPHHTLHTGAGLNIYIIISERSSGSYSSGQHRIGVFVLNIKLFTGLFNATRTLSRCYLRSHLVKTTAGAHEEPSMKHKSNLQTLKSKLQAIPH